MEFLMALPATDLTGPPDTSSPEQIADLLRTVANTSPRSPQPRLRISGSSGACGVGPV